MKKFSYPLLVILLVVAFMPTLANAVNYPAIPAPVDGGYLDLDCLQLSDGSLKNSSSCTSSYKPPATIGTLVLFIFASAIWVGGFIALVSLIYTGAQFVFSGQNPSIRASAKDRLQNVIWGLLLLLLMVGVLNIINPALTNLSEPFLKGVGCAQWDGNKSKCKEEKKEEKRICNWVSEGNLCKERIEKLGMSDPGDPPPYDIPGTFTCTADCAIAENKCTKGFIADTDRCKKRDGASECLTGDSVRNLCVKATFDCVSGDAFIRQCAVGNDRCSEVEGYRADAEFCQRLRDIDCLLPDETKGIPCVRMLYFE